VRQRRPNSRPNSVGEGPGTTGYSDALRMPCPVWIGPGCSYQACRSDGVTEVGSKSV